MCTMNKIELVEAIDLLIGKGFTFEESKDLIDKYKGAYKNGRRTRHGEVVEFLFTLEEWVDWWYTPDDTGEPRINNRGNKPKNWCMGRYLDRGPYHKDNTYLVTVRDNLLHARANYITKEHYYAHKKFFETYTIPVTESESVINDPE